MSPSEKQASREAILQAALQAFGENGYERTRMDDIVRRSGLSKGTLYWHFKNKHDLLLATIDMVMHEVKQTMQTVIELDAPASARLRQMMDQTIRTFLDDPQMIQLIANFFFQSALSDEAQAIMRAAYAYFIDATAQLIQQGIDAGEFRPVDAQTTAIMLLGAADGIAFQSLLNPPWNIRDVATLLVDLLLAGLTQDTQEQAPDD